MDLPVIKLPPLIDNRYPPTNEPWKYKKVVHRWRTEWIPIGRSPCLTPPASENYEKNYEKNEKNRGKFLLPV